MECFAGLGLFGLGGILAGVWGLICNNQTASDRRAIIDRMRPLRGLAAFWAASDAYDAVSYDRHMWYRLTLRDPFKLYPEDLRP